MWNCVARKLTSRLATFGLPVVLDVTLEGTCWCKLTELVANHALRDEHGNVLATVVYRDGVPEHCWDHH